MTTNQTIDGVPGLRDLLMQLLPLAVMSPTAPYRELRALLDAPASVESLVGRTGGGMVWRECAVCHVKGSYHPDVKWCICGRLFEAQAAQPQAEFDYNGWSIDHSAGRPILMHNSCSVIEAEQAYGLLELIKTAAQPQGEPVAYQFQDRDGKWCGFMNERHYQSTVSDGTWPIRTLYAEQSAPVAVASRDESIAWLKRIDGIGQARAELIYSMGFRRHTDVPQS